MRQLHIVQSISEDFGGLGLAALRYAQSLALNGAEVFLYVSDRSKCELEVNPDFGAIKVLGSGGGVLSQAIVLKRILGEQNFDIIHIHGVWTPILAIAGNLAFANNIPLVVSPHGCLEPWALRHRGWKKKIALSIYQRRIFSKAAMIVATARQEFDNIRSLNIESPVAIIPNGVDLPPASDRLCEEGRTILFLSRIHPKKGLRDLIAAWASIRKPGWRIIIAGPDENGHLSEIVGLVNSLGLNDDVEFPGLVTGSRKESLFIRADLFILPTYSENFGIAVAEALARGLPVITTTGAPWEDIVTWRCGWWVNPGVGEVASALLAAINTPREELFEMGQRGVQLVKEKYSWDRIGFEALQAYRWINDPRNERPDFIHVSS